MAELGAEEEGMSQAGPEPWQLRPLGGLSLMLLLGSRACWLARSSLLGASGGTKVKKRASQTRKVSVARLGMGSAGTQATCLQRQRPVLALLCLSASPWAGLRAGGSALHGRDSETG